MRIYKSGDVDVQLFLPAERPDEFWRLAGPVFGSAAAQRELGGPFTDDAQTSWLLAVTADGALRGLASVRVQEGLALLDHAYVLPAERGQGVHRTLISARAHLAWQLGARSVRVLANERSFPTLVRLGFIGTGQRGGYTVMTADALLLKEKYGLDAPDTRPRASA